MPPLLIAYPVIDPVLVNVPVPFFHPSADPLVRAGPISAASSAAGPAPDISSPARGCGARAPTPASCRSTTSWSTSPPASSAGGRLGYVLFYNLPFFLAHTARDPGGVDRRHVVPRRPPRRRGGDGDLRAPQQGGARRRHPTRWRPWCRSACSSAARRQFHQAGALGPPHRRALGDGLSRLRRAAAAPPRSCNEAGLEGIALFALLWIVIFRGGLRRDGLVTALFCIGYALARIVSENFRQPDVPARLLLRADHHGHAALAAPARRRAAAAGAGLPPAESGGSGSTSRTRGRLGEAARVSCGVAGRTT